MAIISIDINQFLSKRASYPILDVRSPSEFLHAHIPGAYNLPLFSDAERAIVGTTYKQESREDAIKTGLKYFGPRMVEIVEEVENLFNTKALAKNKNKEHESKKRFWYTAGVEECVVRV